MDVLPALWLIAKSAWLIGGLIGPGAALMSALRVPRTVATCFAGSAVSLYATVLALQFTGLAFSLASLTGGLALITIAAVVARAVQSRSNAKGSSTDESEFSGEKWSDLFSAIAGSGGVTPIYVAFWMIALWLGWHQPLAGPDVEFRWSFLAEQMLRTGSLGFYPPRSADDFFSYFWVESIPPGASAIHAWAYACSGTTVAAWTVPGVLFQLWAVHEVIGRTAARIGGPVAARTAMLAAAASPLLTWSILLGQETGLTTLSLVGLAYAYINWNDGRHRGWAVLLGIFAALGASAREYGWVFLAVGAGVFVARSADRRSWFAFAGAAALGLVWPLRTWLLTGNPFYSLSPGGLFPINERFVAWIENDADALGGVLRSLSGWGNVGRYLFLFAPGALFGWFALLRASSPQRKNAILALGATAIVLGLWAASVRYTNGGLFYSMRVASPALALGCVAAGVGVALGMERRPQLYRWGALAIGLLVIAQFPATLALPRNPWRTPWREWPAVAAPTSLQVGAADATVALVLDAARASTSGSVSPGVVLADSPGYQRRFLPVGVRVIPWWSPQVDWLFDSKLSDADVVRRWRESDVRYLVVSKWQTHLDFLNTRSRWQKHPLHSQLVGETNLTMVFAIRALD